MSTFLSILQEYIRLGIPEQIDYKKFYLYSLITHSTAIEGSTVTEIENQLLFDEGITAPGRTLQEHMMNLDLKDAYEIAQEQATAHSPYSVKMLCDLSACLMEHTGSTYNTPLGSFSSVDTMLRIHQHNLSAEIAAFNASMEANDTKDDTKQLTDRQQIILDLIREDDTTTISQMIQKIQVSEITIKRELSILKKMGILERIGGRKEGKWLITKHS